MERKEIENALKKVLACLEQAVNQADAAQGKIREGALEVDKALVKIEKAELLIKEIQKAIGEMPKEKGNGQ